MNAFVCVEHISEALKSNTSLTSLSLWGKRTHCFISFSLNTGNDIGNTVEKVYYLSEALKLNFTLRKLDLASNTSCFISFSLKLDNRISPRTAYRVIEVLKSNTSITWLDLGCNRLFASFDSHSVQIMVLELQLPLNYLKYSNQTHLLLHLISPVTQLLLQFILT
jgi:hypothetical protein